MKTYLTTALALTISVLSNILMASPVNINSASAEEIAHALNGIGQSKAQAIVDHRKANGPFKSADDLATVKGIGPKTVEKNKDDIQL